MDDASVNSPGKKVWGMDLPTYCMFMHLSQLLNYVIPFGGLVMPIVMWQVNKAEDPKIDAHGRVIVNWLLSALIYFAICFVLMFVVIGIPLMFVLGLLCIIFMILGAVKAQKGEVWKYPLSIPFFSMPA